MLLMVQSSAWLTFMTNIAALETTCRVFGWLLLNLTVLLLYDCDLEA